MTTLVKGSVTAIPAELLNKSERGSYDWGKLDVGDHYVFPNDEEVIKKVRSSYTAFSSGTKGGKNKPAREARKFMGTVATIKEEGKPEVKEFHVWRLPNPVIATVTETKQEAPVTQEQPKTTAKK